MKNGTLVHCCIFEPHAVAERYVVKPADLDGRTTEGKAWKEANAGREIVDAAQMAAAQAQTDALRRLPEIGALLSDGFGEASAFWIDGRRAGCAKCRPTGPARPATADPARRQDAGTRARMACAASLEHGLHWLQAAWYSDSFERQPASACMALCSLPSSRRTTVPQRPTCSVTTCSRRHEPRTAGCLTCTRNADAPGIWPGYQQSIQKPSPCARAKLNHHEESKLNEAVESPFAAPGRAPPPPSPTSGGARQRSRASWPRCRPKFYMAQIVPA